ncbi:MAG: putative NAD/FAD-binding protein [Planctomycetota bacterium]|jgi:predicted NAD/FAD-binding protein
MKLAVIGTGISGLVAARELNAEHDVTVYEAASWIGGHTNTVDIAGDDGAKAIDTGFIVFNETTYPHFCDLLRELNVSWQESNMSFSVHCDRTGLEYNGTSLNGLLSRRSNALRPSFWRMVRDIMRFYREAPAVLEAGYPDLTLGEFLSRGRYSRAFIDQHLIPMGASVWSSNSQTMRDFPMRFLVQFFHNHGFLRVDDRPQWVVIRGGSREYVRKLTEPFRSKIRLNTPVVSVARTSEGVRVRDKTGAEEVYDSVVLATHADTSLKLLERPTEAERQVLGAFEYQRNEAVLHTDRSVMPKRRRAWASWNYHMSSPASELPTVTYWMNELQSLDSSTQYFVTLNRSADIAEQHTLRKFVYHHPIFSSAAVHAQKRHAEIDGADRVHFAGAYWRYGFHEDGVMSGLAATRQIGLKSSIA